MKDFKLEAPFHEVGIPSPFNLTIKENGSTIGTNVSTINFQGLTINVTDVGSTAAVYIPTVVADILANRPAAASATDVLFIATDVSLFSYSNGISWSTLTLDIINGTTGTLSIARGGTGATTASGARTNLGLGTAATHDATDFDSAGAAATAQSNAEAFATAADTTVLSTAESYADAKVEDTVNGTHHTIAPSGAAAKTYIDSGDAATLTAADSFAAAGDTTTLSTAETYADGKVIDSIADSDTTHAPSRNAVFDALALKQDASTAITTSTSAGGDLTGTYPNPTLGNGTVDTAELVDAAVTLAKMANETANTLLGNNTGSSATPIALTPTQVKALLAIANTDVSGLGTASTKNTGTGSTQVPLGGTITAAGPIGDATHVAQVTFNAAGQLTTVASVAITGSGLDTTAIHSGDSAGGDLTGTYPNPTIGANKVITSYINANAVTLAKLATQADQTILGNNSGGVAVPSALTASQTKTLLALTSSDVGLGSVTNDAQIKAANFPSSSVDSEIVLFSGTGGKTVQRATGSGLVKATSGVYGTVTAPSGAVVGDTDTQTLTNKRLTQRVVSLSDATSFTLSADTADMNTQVNTQSTGTLTANAPSGSPTNGQKIIFRIKSTNVQTYSWNAAFRGSTGLALPTASTGGGKTDYLGFIYNSADSVFDIVAYTAGF